MLQTALALSFSCQGWFCWGTIFWLLLIVAATVIVSQNFILDLEDTFISVLNS